MTEYIHTIGSIDHRCEDYYAMLTTKYGEQGRMTAGNFEKIKKWIRQFEGCRAIIFIRVRTSDDGYNPSKMQGAYGCIRGVCRNLTMGIHSDYVEYVNQHGQKDVAEIGMFDGQHQIENTEVWI